MFNIIKMDEVNFNDIYQMCENDMQLKTFSIGLYRYDEYRENCYIAYDNESIIGYIYGGILCDTLYPQFMYVKPQYRKKGVGRKLLEHLEYNSKCSACIVYYNKELTGFYEKLGYETGDKLSVSMKQIGCK